MGNQREKTLLPAVFTMNHQIVAHPYKNNLS